jgi:hypothetical protein
MSKSVESSIDRSLEIGLKTQIKRQVGLKEWQQDVGDHTQTHLVNAWKKLLEVGMEKEVEEMIWNYCLTSPKKIWFNVNSAKFGIYTNIGEYENKKGYKSLAHFTENGNYLGSVLKLGREPIGYEGNFLLCKTRFRLNVRKLLTIPQVKGSYALDYLFSPVEN